MMVARPSKILKTPPGSRGTSPSKMSKGRPADSRGTSPSRVPNGKTTPRGSPAPSPTNARKSPLRINRNKKSTPGNSPNRKRESSQDRYPILSRGSSPLTVQEELPKSRGSE